MKKLIEYTDEELVAFAQKILAKYNKALSEAKEIAMEYGFEINEKQNNVLNIIYAKLKEQRDAVTKDSVEPAYKEAVFALAKPETISELTELVNLFEAQKYAEVKRKLISMNLFRETRQYNKVKEERGFKAAAKVLRVTLPDGRVICHSKAAETLAEAVDYIGFERVESLNWIVFGQPFVSKRRYPHGQQERNGWYVTTHSNTEYKKRQIERLSELFGLNLVVEMV